MTALLFTAIYGLKCDRDTYHEIIDHLEELEEEFDILESQITVYINLCQRAQHNNTGAQFIDNKRAAKMQHNVNLGRRNELFEQIQRWSAAARQLDTLLL